MPQGHRSLTTGPRGAFDSALRRGIVSPCIRSVRGACGCWGYSYTLSRDTTSSCEPGWFVGGEAADLPPDNLDLERWFKGPKGHERRIHGHRHAGVRSVWQGPTLMLALDAHVHHDGPFTVEDLEPYGRARVPESQQQAVERGKIMRQARSRKKRSVLLPDFDNRYRKSP